MMAEDQEDKKAINSIAKYKGNIKKISFEMLKSHMFYEKKRFFPGKYLTKLLKKYEIHDYFWMRKIYSRGNTTMDYIYEIKPKYLNAFPSELYITKYSSKWE